MNSEQATAMMHRIMDHARRLLPGLIAIASMRAQGQFHLGPAAGVNMASIIQGSDTLTADPVAAPLGGLALDIGLTPALGIAIEPRYIEKGWKVDYLLVPAYGPQIEVQEHTILRFIEAPILLRIASGTGPARLLLDGGVSLGYLAGVLVRARTSQGDWEVLHSEPVLLKDEPIQRVEGSFSLGIGAGFRTGSGWANVMIRYQRGLTDLDASDGSLHTKCLQASLAYLFDLSKK